MNVLVLTRPSDPFIAPMNKIAEAARDLEWGVRVCEMAGFTKNASAPLDMVFLQGTRLFSLEAPDLSSPLKSLRQALRDLPAVCFVFQPEPPFEKDYIEESDHLIFHAFQSPDVLFLTPDQSLVKHMKDFGLNKAFRFSVDGMREAAPIIEQFYREHLLFRQIEDMFTGDARHDFQLMSQGAVAGTVRFNGDYYVYRLASLARDMGEPHLASEYVHMALEVNPAHLKARRLALEIRPTT